ncbi:hypothetical protein [Roseibium sp. Sym1]|uniref:hypothetical protein n=1 Tax=Roseibium sp. Sym1 TaxID=3016006 RepID=UPI0022B5D5FC|nr:hypothetical protein [Roseibium sp. Sym1]
MIKRLALGVVLAGVMTPAMAGIPVEAERTCPVGGETFTIVETLSCTTFGRTMSFRSLSSCDFVTRLPVCPGNGLPLYKEFSPDEVTRLETLLATSAFADLGDLEPWQRAYRIAGELGDTGSKQGFLLLLQALWYESDSFLKNATALEAFVREAEGELERVEKREKPFVAAIVSYTLAAAGQPDRAEDWFGRATALTEALASENGDVTYLRAYLEKVSACRADMSAESCSPNAPFRPE